MDFCVRKSKFVLNCIETASLVRFPCPHLLQHGSLFGSGHLKDGQGLEVTGTEMPMDGKLTKQNGQSEVKIIPQKPRLFCF